MSEPNKRPSKKLSALLDRLLWRNADASASSAGLRIAEARWYRRVYRDPRFDRLPSQRAMDPPDIPVPGGRVPAQLPFRLG